MRLEEQPEAKSCRASWGMVRTLSSVFVCKHQGPLGRGLTAPCRESGLLSSYWCSSIKSFCGQNFWFPGLETKPSFSVPISERACRSCWKTPCTAMCQPGLRTWTRTRWPQQGEEQEQDLGWNPVASWPSCVAWSTLLALSEPHVPSLSNREMFHHRVTRIK